MTASRYVVGIDLGTTNCAVAYADTLAGNDDAPIKPLPLPQVVVPGGVEERLLLPSFLYLPGEAELPAGSLKLPWDAGRDYVVGEFARTYGSQVPTRLVSSAKSWLCHSGVDRRSAILPWGSPEGNRRVSPLDACTRFLRHLVEAWNHAVAKEVATSRLEQQEVVLTVPASFDPLARDLTLEAARNAGLEHVTLLEEPQAAFYAWIDVGRDRWREQVAVGDLVLVADVGGGTTDFTLIEVAAEKGQLVLTRLAVGDHLLLGGDNMDLALAHAVASQFARRNIKLDTSQMNRLAHACRQAKETLFRDPTAVSADVTVLGRGSKVIGGTLKEELSRSTLEQVLLEGFFPAVGRDAAPQRARTTGFQELGLPYATDAAVTRHLAHFISRHHAVLAERPVPRALPNAVLFNGGVFQAAALRSRLTEVLGRWAGEAGTGGVRVLSDIDLELAVARGAAYYGLVRRGKGVRIRGGTAKAYYVGVETAAPAVPGASPPIKALCVAPFGMEEGTEVDVPGQEFGLVVGEPAEFRFLGSSVRRSDEPGALVEDWESEVEELNPVTATLDGQAQSGRVVPVHLHSKVTEIGQLELWCISRDGTQKWKLEFNVRDRP